MPAILPPRLREIADELEESGQVAAHAAAALADRGEIAEGLLERARGLFALAGELRDSAVAVGLFVAAFVLWALGVHA